MKHSKKWISSALVLSLSIGLSACGSATNQKKKKTSGGNSTAGECSDSVTEAINMAYVTAWKIALDETIADAMKGLEAPEGTQSERAKDEVQLKAELNQLVGQPDCSTVVLLSGKELAFQNYSFPKNEGEIDSYAAGLIKKFKEQNANNAGTGKTTSKTKLGLKMLNHPSASRGDSNPSLEKCSDSVKSRALRYLNIPDEMIAQSDRAYQEKKKIDRHDSHYKEKVKALYSKLLESYEDTLTTYLVEMRVFQTENLGAPNCLIEIRDETGYRNEVLIGFSKDQQSLDKVMEETGQNIKEKLEKLRGITKKLIDDLLSLSS